MKKWLLVKILLLFLIASTAPPAILAKEVSITKDQALQQVKNLPEVKKYLSKVPNGLVEIDSGSSEEWLIHVYEIKDGHTATMNWFAVDKKSGKIKKQMP